MRAKSVITDRWIVLSARLFQEWTRELLPNGSEEERAALVRDYRACYAHEGWQNYSVFPGVREMLSQLKSADFPLYVCTSKHYPDAERILEFFKLTPFFEATYGDRPQYPSHGKADLLALLLRERSLCPAEIWMIGDRRFDVEAAHANNIRCLAVEWVYGSPEERVHSDAVAASPADVFTCVAPAGTAPVLRWGPGYRQTNHALRCRAEPAIEG